MNKCKHILRAWCQAQLILIVGIQDVWSLSLWTNAFAAHFWKKIGVELFLGNLYFNFPGLLRVIWLRCVINEIIAGHPCWYLKVGFRNSFQWYIQIKKSILRDFQLVYCCAGMYLNRQAKELFVCSLKKKIWYGIFTTSVIKKGSVHLF